MTENLPTRRSLRENESTAFRKSSARTSDPSSHNTSAFADAATTSAARSARRASTGHRTSTGHIGGQRIAASQPARVKRARKLPRNAKPPRSAKAVTSRPRPTFLSRIVSVGAMLGVGALLLATALPAVAIHPNSADALSVAADSVSNVPVQSIHVATSVLATAPTRDDYTIVNLVAQAKMATANQKFLFTNDVNGTIQWPFPGPVPITSGFGPRNVPGCGFCSTFHDGLDFVPGVGTPIHAIAAGVISEAGPAGPYGTHVMIDHMINGQKVQSLYAHMISGSIQATQGQTVTVGQVLGNVGSTGNSTGPHLHFEVHLNGTPVDPFAWMKANAN